MGSPVEKTARVGGSIVRQRRPPGSLHLLGGDILRRLTTVLTALTVALAGIVVTGSLLRPAEAAWKATPRNFAGYAFDTWTAPPQTTMDAWWVSSPYTGVGIYTSGVNRFDEVQPELTPTWVATQASRGWKLLPIHVGLQASCGHPEKDWERIDPNPAGGYAAARAQGVAEADQAVAAAQALGIAGGSTLWYDLEAFDTNDAACRDSALALVSGWTERLHQVGFKSGFYSSAASGIAMLDDARVDTTDPWVLPDQIWIAHYVSRNDCKLSWGTTSSEYVSDDAWPRNRLRQFCGTHTETYGGVSLSIDSNYLDFGKGAQPIGSKRKCGTTVDHKKYPALKRGKRGDKVEALQCFLKKANAYHGRVHGKYHKGTVKAVKRFQRRADLPVSGKATKRTWTALLAKGGDPLLKYGSRKAAVRRLQRTLNAAEGSRLEVTGFYDRKTQREVKSYQRGRGRPGTGVVTRDVWDLMQQGRR